MQKEKYLLIGLIAEHNLTCIVINFISVHDMQQNDQVINNTQANLGLIAFS